jgi:SAM-dependent methyltransferase
MASTAGQVHIELSDRCAGTLDFIRRSGDKIEIRGWALELVDGRLKPVERFVVSDGRNLFSIEPVSRRTREDLAEKYYDLAEDAEVGFSLELDAAEVNSDVYHIRVVCICRDGSGSLLGSLAFDEPDGLDEIRDRIQTSETLPVPGRATDLPPSWGMVPEPAEEFLGCAGEYLLMMVRYGGLRRTDKFLDVGCGIGRIALALTQYLDEQTPYIGFDIVHSGIDWANRHISRRHPNFRFSHLDLENEYYNPEGRTEEGNFPIEDTDFDFVFLGSVFTHMYYDDVRSYLRQINGHLKDGGTLFATFFLINQESENAVRLGRSDLPFLLDDPVQCFVAGEEPLCAVAFPEERIRKAFDEFGFELVRAPIYGSWTGTRSCSSRQDALIARKVREV